MQLTKWSLRIFYSHVWAAEWKKPLISNPLMVGAVSSIPHWRQLYFLLKLFKPLDANLVQKCKICVENENLEWAIEMPGLSRKCFAFKLDSKAEIYQIELCRNCRCHRICRILFVVIFLSKLQKYHSANYTDSN